MYMCNIVRAEACTNMGGRRSLTAAAAAVEQKELLKRYFTERKKNTMRKMLSKVLALTLCIALGLSLVGGAFAADEDTTVTTTAATETETNGTAAETTGAETDSAEPTEPAAEAGTFDVGAICTDDGQYVNAAIIHLAEPVGATAEELKDAFTVTIKGFTINFYGFIVVDNGDFVRVVEDAAVSEDGKTVTLTLKYLGLDFLSGESLAAKSDFALHEATYTLEVAKAVGTLTTETEIKFSGKMVDPEADKWAKVDMNEEAGTYAYRCFAPDTEKYPMPEEGYPIVVWLHGAGETDTGAHDNNLQLTANRVTAWGQDETQSLFGGAYVLAPQCWSGIGSGWGWTPANVIKTIEAFIAMVGEDTVNRNRITIGGCSMGGMGTWSTLKEYPYYFAAAYPTCGSVSLTDEDIMRLNRLPIYLIHTVEDGTVNISGSLNPYDQMTAAGKTNIYLALYEHTWTVGTPDSTPEELAALAMNGHSSWIYTHNDIDGEKAGDKYFMTTYTHAATGKTYTNTKPSELGYTSFKAWLADQERSEVYFTREREVVAYGEIVRSITVHGLTDAASHEIVVLGKDVSSMTFNEAGEMIPVTSDVTLTPETTTVNKDGSITLTFPTGVAFTGCGNETATKHIVTVDGVEIPHYGDSSEVEDFRAVTYTTPAYKRGENTLTTMWSRYFVPDKTTYAKPADGYPLVVWLHGGGETGTDNRLPVSANDVHAWTEKATQDIFGGAYVLAPQNHAAAGEGAPAATMSVILQFIKQMGDIDVSRVYVGGCSYGGIGTWQMLRNYPNFFAAGYPMCCGPTGGLTDEEALSLVNTPIYMTVSSGDSSGIVSGMIDAYNDITAAGGKDVHIAIFEHSMDDSMPGPIDHWVWVYAHNDYDAKGDDYDGKLFVDSTVDGTYNDGAVVVKDGVLTYTYTANETETSISLNGKTERPEDTGYATFKTYLAAQTNKAPSVFKDVDGTTLNNAAILQLAINSLTKGTNAAGTTYEPDATLTRAEFVTFLSRVAGATVDNTADTGFADVAVNSWETGAIAWAVENGLIVGHTDGTFAPTDPVTEAEVNIIVDRVIENLSGFTAADGQKLAGAETPATRAQIAGVIEALHANYTAPSFNWGW